MTYSIYDEICLLEKNNASNSEVKDKLIDIGIFGIFSEAYDKYENTGTFRLVVFFIAHAYSYESKKIIIGQDWKKCKVGIAQAVKLPTDHFEDIIDMKDLKMQHCMNNFMNLYQKNVDFVHIQHLKDMYQRIIEMGTKFKTETDGSADLDENFTNIKRAEELLEKIRRHEAKMKKDYRSLNSPEEELSSILPSNYRVESLAVEHSNYIKK